eukprot:TRINITY_DN25164_c0_g1_i2.p3 TRINITY_DN25164_c0_g1~~TRINITY_DN25164_c0_g1_i2.p3  ORF type:complete len:160 (-),score=53.38 TRINITY_DN25164_c0_g1_i2:81-560(-)
MSSRCSDNCGGAAAKGKTSKAAKGKRRKDSGEDEALVAGGKKKLEDIELELAAAIAAREEVEQHIASLHSDAESRFAEAKKHVARRDAERKEIIGRLDVLRREAEKIASERKKLDQAKAEQVAKVEGLEKAAKDAERAKIRIRLDIKMATDSGRSTANE